MNYGDKPLTIPPEEGGTPHTERTVRAITEVGLPPLRGAEADIATAGEIRLNKLIEADEVLTRLRVAAQETELGQMSANPPQEPVSKSVVKTAQVALDRLRHQEDAAWWLAQRDRSVQELLDLFAEGREIPPAEQV